MTDLIVHRAIPCGPPIFRGTVPDFVRAADVPDPYVRAATDLTPLQHAQTFGVPASSPALAHVRAEAPDADLPPSLRSDRIAALIALDAAAS